MLSTSAYSALEALHIMRYINLLTYLLTMGKTSIVLSLALNDRRHFEFVHITSGGKLLQVLAAETGNAWPLITESLWYNLSHVNTALSFYI